MAGATEAAARRQLEDGDPELVQVVLELAEPREEVLKAELPVGSDAERAGAHVVAQEERLFAPRQRDRLRPAGTKLVAVS